MGRVVIPKEIRRTMRIREGDPLQIHMNIDTFCRVFRSIVERYNKNQSEF